MRRIFHSLLINLISMCNYVTPKTRIIIFCSFPDACDNALALFDYLTTCYPDKYRYIWLLKWGDLKSTQARLYRSNVNTKCVKKDSLLGVYYFLRAKYVFFTHGIYGRVGKPRRQIAVHLTHGMPLKKFGLLDHRSRAEIPYFNYVVTTSPLFQPIFAKAYGVPEKLVLSLGSPRNDTLFEFHHVLEKLGVDRQAYQKVILWMPTYRISVVGEIRQDGSVEDSGLPLLSTKDLEDFNNFLKQNGDLCIIKTHPMDHVNIKRYTGFSNIRFFDHTALLDVGADVHFLLQEVDALLTDYSSIAFDFMLLDRPIGYVQGDMHEYEASRGFVLYPTADWTPGKQIQSFEAMKIFIQDLHENIDVHAEMRRDVRGRVHRYTDANSRKRLVEYLGI